jgi:hypothetical protein
MLEIPVQMVLIRNNLSISGYSTVHGPGGRGTCVCVWQTRAFFQRSTLQCIIDSSIPALAFLLEKVNSHYNSCQLHACLPVYSIRQQLCNPFAPPRRTSAATSFALSFILAAVCIITFLTPRFSIYKRSTIGGWIPNSLSFC